MIPHFRGIYRDDEPARAVYSETGGIAQIIPRAVAVPADASDVITLVRWAAQENVPLIPRGSGSSMSGGAIGDGVIVDFGALAFIDTVDREKRTIRCGPAVTRHAVDAAARAAGLVFPVDPSSGAFASVGGMASTNASGAHTLKYGSMRPWVEALDCVFADGSRTEIRRGRHPGGAPALQRFDTIARALIAAEAQTPSRHIGVRKESSGYALHLFAHSRDLVDLLVGSEGTLALIVGLELRLSPMLPATASVLGAFDSLDAAVVAAGAAREAGAVACELLDRTFLDVARRGGAHVPVPEHTDAVLLAEVEANSAEECGINAAALARSFRSSGATTVELALDAATEHAMWELRHAASPILSRLDPSLKSMQVVEDGCVPPDRLADYVRGIRAALHANNLYGVIFGHAGDAHMHVNAMVDVRDPQWRQDVEGLLQAVTSLTASLGGTISGEHGDGRLRAPLLAQLWPAASLERFAAVKQAFDPHGILNPGAKLAAAGARAIERVKYDPMLAPLAPAARAVLTRVENDRAYAHSRLTLLAEEAHRLDAVTGGA
ncbi:MAG: linked oxidase domain protein [Gemmatimonadetes bacterium]|nr:linked oxidase domain protein [Gemmatimonadota bacterium]